MTIPSSLRQIRDPALAAVVDVILDALPGNDYRSALSALLEGIPLITLPGKMPEERVTLSLMGHLGESTGVAASGLEYVDLATRLASDHQERKVRAARLQSLWQRASDEGGSLSMVSFTRRFEKALEAGASRPEAALTAATFETQP